MSYECDNCAACCVHLIIEIEPVDIAREPRLRAAKPFKSLPDELYFDDDDEATEYRRVGPLVPGYEAGAMLACGASSPCPLLGSDKLCTVYPTRPTCCVAMQAGSDLCQQARGMAGLPPLVAMRPPC